MSARVDVMCRILLQTVWFIWATSIRTADSRMSKFARMHILLDFALFISYGSAAAAEGSTLPSSFPCGCIVNVSTVPPVIAS